MIAILEQQDAKFDPNSKDSVYANPEIVSAGKGVDGKPTFYIVVNTHGLDKLKETGFLSEEQHKRTMELFEIRKVTVSPKDNDKPLLEVADEAVKDVKAILDTMTPPLFIIEAKKTGDKTEAVRVFSGKAAPKSNLEILFEQQNLSNAALFAKKNIARLSSENRHIEPQEDRLRSFKSVDQTEDTASKKALPGITIHINKTLNISQNDKEQFISPGLPAQEIDPIKMLLEKSKDNNNYLPTKENAETFRKAVDAQRDELAKAEIPDPKMRDALAKANDPNHVPAGYTAPTGQVLRDKSNENALG
jgi:hypothetical protein